MEKEIRKQVTDNPLLDEIIYQCQIMINGLVIKDEQRALDNETLESVRHADIYEDILMGNISYNRFTYTFQDYRKLDYLNARQCKMYAQRNELAPEKVQQDVLRIKSQEFLNDYEDKNNYYRMLNGLPDYGTKGILLSKEEVNMIEVENFDHSIYVHEMDQNQIDILELTGVLDHLKERFPDQKYLWHLGSKKIDPYFARKALPFSLLYLPPVEATEVSNKFTERLEINRVYILKTVYSEAYKVASPYYDRFIIMMIILQSLDDMIVLSPEYIIRRELFDMRTIEYIFHACGVDFFPEIPLKYQKRLVKNLNRLIKYKSTDKNLIDICKLFGFEDINIFKYYLLKIPLTDEDGEYMNDVIENPITGETMEDVYSNYELKFLRVPFDGNIDETIRDDINYYDYDDITLADKYWDSEYDHEEIKHKLLEEEFNLVITKYISVQTTYSVAEMSFQLAYFINMVLYSGIDLSRLTLEVPEINSRNKYNLIDLIIFLYSMMYLYNETKDSIIYDPVLAMDVKGFNFETDMNTLASYVAEKGFTLEELGVSGFQNPNTIYSFNQLVDIYTNNKNIHDHLITQMNNANDKNIYDIYRTIYESLYVTKLNFDYFKNGGTNHNLPKTYKEFLANRCASLYTIIKECSEITKQDERRLAISKYINYIADNIYIYIDSEEFRFIFQNIPTLSLDYIKQYLFMVIRFFKSYKVDLIETNNIYLMDDKLENKITIIDRILYNLTLDKHEHIDVDDFKKLTVKPELHDGIDIDDIIYIVLNKWKRLFPTDYYRLFERIPDMWIKPVNKDYILTEDTIAHKHYNYHKKDLIQVHDAISERWIRMVLKDHVILDDYIYTPRTTI